MTVESNRFSGKTVLVTGATGLIGEYLCKKIFDEGGRVIALSRNEDKLYKCFGKIIDSAEFKYIVQDVSVYSDIKEPVDVIFHAAGPIASNIIKNKPVDVISPNIIGTNNLLNLLKYQKEKYGVSGKIVLCSSATVYANASDENIKVTEEDTLLTYGLSAYNTPYSESKRMMEVMADAYNRQHNIDIAIGRLSYVYGPATYKADTALYEFIGKVLQSTDIVVNNPSMEKRDWIYVDDAIEGLMLLALQSSDDKVFNISSGGEGNNFIAVDEIADIAIKIYRKICPNLKQIPKIIFNNKYEKKKPGIILDNSKIKKLGFKVKYDITAGVKKTMTGCIGT